MARERIPGIDEVLFPKAMVNAFVVRADVLTLIDTGTPGGAGKLAAAAARHARIERIIITHRHADHAGNAAALARLTGAEVHVSPADGPYVREGREQPRPVPVTPLGQAMVRYVSVALPWKLEPVPDARETLVDGAMIGPFRVVATPGHTAGHVSLLWEERRVLFTADAAANITGVGPHPVADDPDTAAASFRRLATLDFDAACFGHGRAIAAGAAPAFRTATTELAAAPA